MPALHAWSMTGARALDTDGWMMMASGRFRMIPRIEAI
jgi:hypothetical protein